MTGDESGMPNAQIHLLHGVNLGKLGERRPEVYGGSTLAGIEAALAEEYPAVSWSFYQTDIEGELVRAIHSAADSDGLILNPGAWTHYAYALHDALEMLRIPKVEVHLSNVHGRENWRRHSVISPAVDAVIAGMGAFGYRAAAEYILDRRKG